MDIRSIAANLRACGITSVRQMEQITTELLCNRPTLPNCGCGAGTSSGVQDMQVAWTPTNLKLGEMISFESLSVGQLSGILTLAFNQTQLHTIDIEDAPDLTLVSFPNLTTVDSSGYILIGNQFGPPDGTPNVNSILLPKLSVTPDLEIYLTSITTLDLPALTSTSFGVFIKKNTLLTSINLPLWTATTSGQTYDFSQNALNVATVNQILAGAIANAGYVAGTIDVSGQTPAAPPSGQGIADKAALILRGVTVNTD